MFVDPNAHEYDSRPLTKGIYRPAGTLDVLSDSPRREISV